MPSSPFRDLKTLVKVVDMFDELDLNNKDIMGDVYEYLFSKTVQSCTNGQFRAPRHITMECVPVEYPPTSEMLDELGALNQQIVVERSELEALLGE